MLTEVGWSISYVISKSYFYLGRWNNADILQGYLNGDSSDQPSLLAANPELPVYLKKFGTESLLLAKEVLKAGTVLGTYKGATVQEGETEEGDTFIKVNRSDGGSPVHVMLEDDGHWLKLMRTATIPTDANICLRISGKDIICTVTKDVNKEVELKVTCRIADPCHEKQFDPTLLSNAHRKSPEASSFRVKEVEELEEREIVPKDCTSPKAMLDCVQNSVCSFNDSVACTSSYSVEVSEEKSVKSEPFESDIDMEEFREEVSSSTTRESPSSDTNREIKIKVEDDVPHLNQKPGDVDERHVKTKDDNVMSRSPEYEYGNSESYDYEKHNWSHHSSSSSRNGSNATNPKAFCEACKIQFLSVNTYQVHKKYYCKSRHENEDVTSPLPTSEASSGISTAFKPSVDTVILRSAINGNVTPSVIQPQAIYAAISTNPLILLPCTLVPGQGLVPQNGVLPTGTPGIVLQSGIACPTIVEKPSTAKAGESSCPPRKTSHPVMNSTDETNDKTLLSSTKIATLKRKMSEGDVLNLKKTCTSNDSNSVLPNKNPYEPKDIEVDQDSPLDLSIKIKKANDSSTRKSPIRRRSSVISVSHPSSPGLRIAGSGSPPTASVIASTHSAPSPTNSYSNESTCYTTQVPVVVHRVPPVESVSPLPPVLQSAIVDKTIPPPGMMPPKLMKQGNNICDECHIVFIKYDNLVTHKKHYCAYRRRQLSAMAAAAAAASAHEQSSDDNNSNHSGINESAQGFQNEDTGKSGLRKIEYGMDHYRPVIPKPPQPQYCCDACGVKFSTSDTLVAHQTYYCMKKPDSAMAKASNKKGDDSNSTIDSPFSGPEEWKCNYCEASCSSYETMRRHLLTHTEPRGYRCLLCGYKGNTLRGMRTHACEHLTEDSTSVDEFMSTTVISEGGGLPIIPRTLECSDEDSDVQKEASPSYRQRERTSSDNSDVIRDRTLKVADLSESEEHSFSPRTSENDDKEPIIKKVCSIKAESNDSSSDINGNQQEIVNPLAFCDVVIKAENDQNGSGDDSDRVEVKKEPDYDSDERPSATSHPQSVIRMVEKQNAPHSSKRKSKTVKSGADAKLCKACGVTFQHWSNFLTHKKFYCDSRTLQNCIPETATVQ